MTTTEAAPSTTEPVDLVALRADVAQAVRDGQQWKERPLASAHEGYAIIRGCLGELWDEVTEERGDATPAVAVAAAAAWFVHDIGGWGAHEEGLTWVLDRAFDELTRATGLFGAFASPWEGWAVIAEELDELWDEVKADKAEGAEKRQLKEALQVAAMALRFVVDLGGRA